MTSALHAEGPRFKPGTKYKFFIIKLFTREFLISYGILKGSMAEWSKAPALGAGPKGRGFEPHCCHYFLFFQATFVGQKKNSTGKDISAVV